MECSKCTAGVPDFLDRAKVRQVVADDDEAHHAHFVVWQAKIAVDTGHPHLDGDFPINAAIPGFSALTDHPTLGGAVVSLVGGHGSSGIARFYLKDRWLEHVDYTAVVTVDVEHQDGMIDALKPWQMCASVSTHRECGE